MGYYIAVSHTKRERLTEYGLDLFDRCSGPSMLWWLLMTRWANDNVEVIGFGEARFESIRDDYEEISDMVFPKFYKELKIRVGTDNDSCKDLR